MVREDGALMGQTKAEAGMRIADLILVGISILGIFFIVLKILFDD